MPNPRITAILSLKGGVGKTTSAVNIAACIAQAGRKTLLVDLDPYTGASVHLGVKIEELDKTIADVLTDPEANISEAVYETANKNLFIAPSDESLASCEAELEGEIGRENFLLEAFGEHVNGYDFVIIDLPPTSSFLTVSALRVSREVLVPFRTSFMGIEVVEEINELVEKVRHRLNPDIRILGYFGTMYEQRTKESQLSLDDMRQKYGDKVFKTVIPANTKLAEAPRSGVSGMEYARSSSGAKSYKALVREAFGI